ncbi:MAG: hypothetical protein KDB32_05645 [Planctomycetes bacterium]|nr:hypothetical protein [Planctomycetota bacterium]
MKYLILLSVLGLAGCASDKANDTSAPVAEHQTLCSAEQPTVGVSELPSEPEPEFEVLQTELGRDNVGHNWRVSFARRLGEDSWNAEFFRDGDSFSRMEIGVLKPGHQPSAHIENWAQGASFIVLRVATCWGSGVWRTDYRWFALNRLDDVDATVLELPASGWVGGWGLAFDREFSLRCEHTQTEEVAVNVTGLFEVIWDEKTLFVAEIPATYIWDAVARCFNPESPEADEVLRGMWEDGEDGFVAHHLPELKNWLASPKGDPGFIRELNDRAELDDTRIALANLLDSQG